ncbi:hypothetical protein CBW65_18080 [Tumebacillus avium]|uniref:HNH domain-containing protein n=1 Tax=Tumebacillus avium TaxID=1903704 RepID=A0A1Y0IQW6_9BACL|nr:HNH endonuclease [Tumebacillus avium]ARU62670.1 hypothetical protein CBW65_18080 [Tumebacillus avium]
MKGVYFKERTVSGRYIHVGEIEALLDHFPPNYDSEVGFSEDDNSFTEGRKMMRLHLVRERNHKLIALAKENYKRIHGKLICEICRFDFEENYGIVGRDYIEGHHIVPMSELSEDHQTKVEDIALVCANCHRMLHRKRPWLTMSQLKRLLKKPNIELQ